MQNNGLKQGTLKAVNYQLKYLDKNTNLMNPEQVKAFIATTKQANSYKQCIVKAYNYFADVDGIQRLRQLLHQVQQLHQLNNYSFALQFN
ncbi:MAG: hypothetical protein ABSA75_11380 [Candidatus Bathyarchaeia archaeon]